MVSFAFRYVTVRLQGHTSSAQYWAQVEEEQEEEEEEESHIRLQAEGAASVESLRHQK